MEGVSWEERCGLVGELTQVLEMVRQLDAHMTAGGGEERCRALVATMRASIDRSVRIARSCCDERLLPVFVGPPESPPSGGGGGGGGGGSPTSAGSDQAGDFRGRGNNAAVGQCKKRKTLPRWNTQVRVSAVQDVTPLDDGLSWRKYGQKDILNAKYPRSVSAAPPPPPLAFLRAVLYFSFSVREAAVRTSDDPDDLLTWVDLSRRAYFRCTHRHTQGCQASKQVQRVDGDPLLFDVVYHGNHTCAQATALAQPAGNNQPATASGENSNKEQQAAASPTTFDRTVLPFLLPSDKPGSDNGCGLLPAGCVAASTLMPPAAESQQLVSSGSGSSYYAVEVRNAPEVELASTTNSPMADMDFMFSLDDAADFLENTANYF
ncbi:hypothetical protein PR202_gb05322 [Eleusine coracana subsp. coracana]|uniref:WRKY domain-containing protein n=1 Tax=Eleusine coracana subsp. coracana TaxID=191504 RepID=A0AAV5E6F1_ELECO|nr:hypothetical protein PR202_gb05322 [Eleusine coracana subsp. coracana]